MFANKKIVTATVFGVVVIAVALFFTHENQVALYDNEPAMRVETDSTGTAGGYIETTSDQADEHVIQLVVDQDGQNVFELLKAQRQVEYDEYDFGVFITSIDGIAGDDSHFWALYVNDALSQTGADQTQVNANDIVEFKYEEITGQ